MNIHYAKTNLSRLIEAVNAGEEVVISRAGTPVAKLIPFAAPVRQLGFDKGLVSIAADFDAPLPEETLLSGKR